MISDISLTINEGGPGGSGVLTVVGTGAELREVVGDGFDILGFDPRGKASVYIEQKPMLIQNCT